MIGVFGDLIFEVSSERVLTFSDFAHNVKARFAKHELVNQTPVLEYLGAETDKITLEITLTATLGVNPQAEIDLIQDLCLSGVAEYLVIGDRVIGDTRFVITDASTKWQATDGDGNPIVAVVNVTFESYISEIPT